MTESVRAVTVNDGNSALLLSIIETCATVVLKQATKPIGPQNA